MIRTVFLQFHQRTREECHPELDGSFPQRAVCKLVRDAPPPTLRSRFVPSCSSTVVCLPLPRPAAGDEAE